MSTLKIDLEEDLANLLQQVSQPLERAVKESVILELYRRGLLSGGRAGEILNISHAEFIQHASKVGIPFFALTGREWEDERAASEKL